MITLIDACEIIKIAEDNNFKLYIDFLYILCYNRFNSAYL